MQNLSRPIRNRMTRTRTLRGISITIAICIIMLLGSVASFPTANSGKRLFSRSPSFSPPSSAPFDHIVTILMENQGLCDVYTGCGGSATYMSGLADANVLVRTWGTIGHNSEPNYIALLGAFDDSSTNGDGVCCYFESQQNIIDKIENAGLTWQAFAEDAGNTGTCGFSPPRDGDHFSFKDFSDMNTSPRCSRFATTASNTSPISGSCSSPSTNPDPEFITSLTQSAPNFVWLTPNDCDNMHDSSVTFGDNYLSYLVPKILASPLFASSGSKATLLVLFDEGYTNCNNNTGGTGECVYASFIGPTVKKGTQLNTTSVSHYSFSSTLEAAWGLGNLGANDVGAPTLTSAFAPCTSNCSPPGNSNPSSNGNFLGLSITTWLIISGAIVAFVAVLTLYGVRVRFKPKQASPAPH